MSPIVGSFGAASWRGFRGSGAPRAVQYVGSNVNADPFGSNYSLALNNLSGGVDTQARTGDLVIIMTSLVLAQNITVGTTLTGATGWTNVGSLYRGGSSSTYATNVNMYHKVMGSTPETSVTVTGYGVSYSSSPSYPLQNGIAVVFRNVAWGAVATATNTGQNFAPAAITPTVPGTWIGVLGAANGSNAGFPSNMTFADVMLSQFNNLSPSPYVLSSQRFGYFSGWTSGTYTPGQWGSSADTTRTWASYTFTLVPT